MSPITLRRELDISKPFVLIEEDGKYYLPILALEKIVEIAVKGAKKISLEGKFPLEDIGIDLDKFHTLNIHPEFELTIKLVRNDK